MNLQEQLKTLSDQISSAGRALEAIAQRLTPEQHSNAPDLGPLSAYLGLGASISEDRLLSMILKSAMYVVSGGGAGLTLLDPSSHKLVFRAAIGDGADGIIGYEVPLQGSQHGLAFATGEVQASTPLNKDIEDQVNTHFRNVLVAPLLVDDGPIGTISAVNKQNGEHFTVADIDAYRHFADLAALVVRQRQREAGLYQLLQAPQQTSTELPILSFTEQDRQIAQIMRSVVTLSSQQPDLLPLCQQLISLVAKRQL
ncbi:Putative GAF sensor protein [Pseudomonas sp. 9AZ]|uniref:GAF domain-containing protein n=1 Tax=Pseudomonas sp. 9AZ TaxID=2653168 RepID=UPI0012F026C0|nr:GAF domain-containing protein [Pseudomonas sp. 9AZ]VXD00216.1 Putative GAF sensor protein [Pseudomonas sp. 9AZ]